MDKALYVLAELDDQTQKTLSGYYEKLVQNGFPGTQTKEIPYHLTMGSYPCDMERKLTGWLDEKIADMSGVTLLFDHIGLFGLNVLFLAPNVTHELLTLKEAITFDGTIDEFPWAAHATMLIDTPENILRALPVVADMLPLEARIDSIGLYEFFPKRGIKKYSLK